LGIQGTPEMVADYRIMEGIIGVIIMISSAFIGVLLPSTSKIVAQKNKEAYYLVAYDATKYISIIVCLCCFGLMTVGPSLITLYVGPSYLFLMPWFNLWIICMLASHVQAISSLILSGANLKPLVYISALACVLGMLVTWFTIPYYHAGGTVIGYAIYIATLILFYYFYYWPCVLKIKSTRVFFKCFLPYTIIGLGCFLLCMILPKLGNNLISTLYLGFVFFVIYTILSYFTLNEKDKNLFRYIFKMNRSN
jgi:O-antigen/teichoic acid export membrane protein